jgi:hypothetical protein
VNRDALEWDIGQTILTTYDENGFLGIGVDVPGGDAAGTSTFDACWPCGTFSRPRDPTVGVDGQRKLGATTLYAYLGPGRSALVVDDPRVVPKLPLAPKGTWGAYGDTGRDDLTVMVLDGDTGSFALRVPHSIGDVSSRILVDVSIPGTEEILLAHGGGCEVSIKALEAVVGDTAIALALAKAVSVQGVVSALQTVATAFIAFGPPTPPNPLTPLAAIGTALQVALAALPPIPTTKLRSE